MASHFEVSASEYQYHGIHSLQALEEAKTPFVIFSHMDERSFTHQLSLSHLRNRPIWYLHREQLLLVKMPSLPHELAHAHLNVTLALILGGMNLVEEIDFLANAHVYSGGHTKRPDQSYIPSVLPAGRSGVWPSVVIETGYPERSARWWLEESRGDVRAVISVSVHQKMRKITLTHWQAVPPRRPTRATAGQLVAQGTQEVVITQEDKDSPIEVTNGPFVVPFSSFFLRDATPGTAEKDIEWSVDSLKLLARKVWAKHPNV